MLEHRGYVGVAQYEPDERAFHGDVVGLRDVLHFSGQSVDELEASFRDAVDGYLAFCAADGVAPEKPMSGRILLRTTPDLHRQLTVAAARAGQSVNTFAVEALTRAAAEALRAPRTPGLALPSAAPPPAAVRTAPGKPPRKRQAAARAR